MGKARHQAIQNRDEDDGNRAARLLHHLCRRATVGQDQVRRESQQLRGGGSYPIGVAQSPLKIDLNIAADNPAELLESFPERRGAALSFRIVLRIKHQHADPPHPLALPRPRRYRPRRRAAKQRDELAAFHCLGPPVLPTERIAHLR
jgi:hypothetical protein